MGDYHAPRRDQQFVLEHLAKLNEVLALPGYEEFSPDLVQAVLDEAATFASEVLAPQNRPGDISGCRLVSDGVRLPEGWPEVYAQFRSNGWTTLGSPVDCGGQGMPKLVSTAVEEMWSSANLSFALLPFTALAAVAALHAHACDTLKATYLPKMVSGEWGGTMNLTEPHAGSDLSTLRTRAEPQPDGRHKLFGQKIFITYGDQDATENIVHLVLARLPDAPPGVKGISLFVCPKYLVNADGSLGARNDVRCVAIEHKLGIHASPTCVMAYGDHGGAVADLVGEPNRGLEYMFVMMNEARFGVGLQGLAISERAWQLALTYARDRSQGRDAGTGEHGVAIIRHPDVKRMLLSMRSRIMAMRGLIYCAATQLDIAARDPDSARADQARRLADLLMPVVKGWSTDVANEICSLGVQIHGGMGFVEETGAAQHMRDARILTIYEGTNGIQAIDLVGRKLQRDEGRTLSELTELMRTTAARLQHDGELAVLGNSLTAQIVQLERAKNWLLEATRTSDETLGSATPFLLLLGTICGSWQLGRLALIARSETDHDNASYRAQLITLARFYDRHHAVEVPAFCARLCEGSHSIREAELS